jgi:hypothetical protein
MQGGSSGIQTADIISATQGQMANVTASTTTSQPTTTPPPNPAQSKIQNFNQQAATSTPKQPGQGLSASRKKQIEQDVDKEKNNKQSENDTPISDAAGNALSGINDQFDKLQITKGLGIAFAILVFLVWLLIPTSSGYTRLQLLWFTVMGETQINQASKTSSPNQNDNSQQDNNQQIDLSTPPATQVDGPPSHVDLSNIDFSALDYNGA